MLTWPHDRGDWGELLPAVEEVFINLAAAITRFESCLVVCRDDDHRQAIKQLLLHLPQEQLVFALAESNDIWARDHGPLTVMCSQEPMLLNFRFNGWGGKHGSDLDNAIVSNLYQQDVFGDSAIEDVDFVFEGGAIEVDGSGTFLATRHSVITDTRNPGKSQGQVEKLLSDRLGIERFLWLNHGALEGDDTDGHIDTLARFVNRDTILYCHCSDENDTHFAELNVMEAELKQFRSATGAPFKLVPLPLPSPKLDEDGQRLPATYANFLIINGAVLVPTYNDARDEDALKVFHEVFPDREIIAIDCLPLVHQYGSLHCATMQIPRSVQLRKT